MTRKGGVSAEGACLGFAAVLYGLMLGLRIRHGPIPWAQSPVYVPTGLVALALLNGRLRAKGLAWGIFTVSLVLFMIVFGTWVVVDRASAVLPWREFLVSSAFYAAVGVSGLFQLRLYGPTGGPS